MFRGSGGYTLTRNSFSLKSNEQTALCPGLLSCAALKSAAGKQECNTEQRFLIERFTGSAAEMALYFKAAKLHNKKKDKCMIENFLLMLKTQRIKSKSLKAIAK